MSTRRRLVVQKIIRAIVLFLVKLVLVVLCCAFVLGLLWLCLVAWGEGLCPAIAGLLLIYTLGRVIWIIYRERWKSRIAKALLAFAEGDFARTDRILRETFRKARKLDDAGRRRRWGYKHVTQLYVDLAHQEVKSWDFARRTLDVWQSEAGDMNGDAASGLALFAENWDDFDSASDSRRAALECILEMCRRHVGPEDHRVAMILCRMAEQMPDEGPGSEEVQPLLEQAARILAVDYAKTQRETRYKATWRYKETVFRLARIYDKQGRLDQAVAVLEPAVPHIVKAMGYPPWRDEVRYEYAYYLKKAGRLDEAVALETSALGEPGLWSRFCRYVGHAYESAVVGSHGKS
jgi:tetratricopeptide (TPR) repeat protein